MIPGPVLSVVDGPDGFGDPREWNTLVANSRGGSFFQSAQWQVGWWTELAGRPELAVARVHERGRLVGAASLARIRQPLGRRSWPAVELVINAGSGTGAADHCGFPIAEDAGGAVRDSIWEWVLGWHSGDPLLLANFAPGSDITEIATRELKAVASAQCPTMTVPMDTDFEAVRDGWTKNRRKTLVKKLRQFHDAGGSFTWDEDPDAAVRLLPTVFSLHDARRLELGRSSRFGHSAENRAFHRRLAEYADEVSGCWVQRAQVGDATVGILYGFRLGRTYSVFQSGWDPSWRERSIGLIQYANALQHTIEAGATSFDMCRGTDPYKLRFATEITTERSFARTNGVGGKLLAARLAWLRRRESTKRVDAVASVDEAQADTTVPTGSAA